MATQRDKQFKLDAEYKKATNTSARNAVMLVARCLQSRDCCIGNHLLVFVVSPFVSSHFQTENVL